MYDLKPRGVFVHERVYENPRAVERMERMLAALGRSRHDVPTVGMGDLGAILDLAGVSEDIASEQVLKAGHGFVRQGLLKREDDPVLVFNTFVWDESRRLPAPRRYANPHASRLQAQFCGVGEGSAFSKRELLTPEDNFVCQGGWGVHTLGGCVHKCDYCGEGFIVNIMLDIEEFCEHLAAMFQRRPEQLLYRYDLFSDILAFEPEYGASQVLARCFAEHGKYLLLYTRSDNVEWLGDLPCKEHVPINWTLSMETQARVIERDSPSLAQRIEAMRFCQEHGFTVRAGFTPILPVKDWRRETTEMLELLFSRVRPEVLRGWVLAMMDADEFERIFNVDMMDQDFMRRMREDAAELNGQHHAPFPLDVRRDIYEHYIREVERLSPETPFALCTEHPGLWDMLECRLKMTRDRMFCCCGGLSTPGGGQGKPAGPRRSTW